MGDPVLSPWDFDQGTGGCSQVGERRVGAQAVMLGKVLPGAGFGIPSRQGHLVQVIAFILAAVTETHFIPAPSNPALTARTGSCGESDPSCKPDWVRSLHLRSAPWKNPSPGMERSNEPCTNSTLRAQSIFIALCVSLPRVWLWPGCRGLQAARSRQDFNGQESVPRALSWLKARPRWAAPLQRLAGRRVLLSQLLSPRVPAHQDSGALIVTSRLLGGLLLPPVLAAGVGFGSRIPGKR